MASESATKNGKQWKGVATMEAVARGDLTLSQVAMVHSVHRKTLDDL